MSTEILSLAVSTKRFFLPSAKTSRPLATRVRLLNQNFECVLDVQVAPPTATQRSNTDISEMPSICEVKARVLKDYIARCKVVVGFKVWESLAALNISGAKRVPEAVQVVDLKNSVDRSALYY